VQIDAALYGRNYQRAFYFQQRNVLIIVFERGGKATEKVPDFRNG